MAQARRVYYQSGELLRAILRHGKRAVVKLKSNTKYVF